MNSFYIMQLTHEQENNKRQVAALKYREKQIEDELAVLNDKPTSNDKAKEKVAAEKKKPSTKEPEKKAPEKETESKTIRVTDDATLDALEKMLPEFKGGTHMVLNQGFDLMDPLSMLGESRMQPYLDGSSKIGSNLYPLDVEKATTEGIKSLTVLKGLIAGRNTKVVEVEQKPMSDKNAKMIAKYTTRIDAGLWAHMMTRKPLKEAFADLKVIHAGLEGA